MGWPDDLYRGIPIRRDDTRPEYLRRWEDERRQLTYDEKNALLDIARRILTPRVLKGADRHD